MWNESATKASEWTAYPVMSSIRKKTLSMTRRMLIRVDFERPILMSVLMLIREDLIRRTVLKGDLSSAESSYSAPQIVRREVC